jgi:predicted nucleotidyltransferase
MRSVIQRTIGVEASLRQALANLPGIQEASIFGSYAAGREREGSDVDLLVVGSPPSDELRRRIGKIGRELRRDVNLVELTSAELRKLRAKRDPFIGDVLSGPRVVLIGGPPKRA